MAKLMTEFGRAVQLDELVLLRAGTLVVRGLTTLPEGTP
jgi:hypothetical protein